MAVGSKPAGHQKPVMSLFFQVASPRVRAKGEGAFRPLPRPPSGPRERALSPLPPSLGEIRNSVDTEVPNPPYLVVEVDVRVDEQVEEAAKAAGTKTSENVLKGRNPRRRAHDNDPKNHRKLKNAPRKRPKNPKISRNKHRDIVCSENSPSLPQPACVPGKRTTRGGKPYKGDPK